MYECMNVCMHVCMYECMSACLSLCLCICVSMSVCLCICASVCLCVCVSVSVCLCVCVSLLLSALTLPQALPLRLTRAEMCSRNAAFFHVTKNGLSERVYVFIFRVLSCLVLSVLSCLGSMFYLSVPLQLTVSLSVSICLSICLCSL